MEPVWNAAEKGYQLALAGGKLRCRNAKGKELASVPKWLRESDMAAQFLALRDWLGQHRQQCLDTVETWMLRSLPVPRDVLLAVWPDPTWQSLLRNVVACPVRDGGTDTGGGGYLREIRAGDGVGVVDLDGETDWLTTDSVCLPHPILLPDLTDYKELAAELDLAQGVHQLFRETYAFDPAADGQSDTEVTVYGDAKFEQLSHVLSLCRRLNYQVKGGFAVCSVWAQGAVTSGRYWVGADHPEGETYTGSLSFTDGAEGTVRLADVNPVAFSEGMRMAAAIHAKRVVDEEDEQ